MKKLRNDRNDYADRTVDGLGLAHPEFCTRGARADG